jgi:hypothetical protein
MLISIRARDRSRTAPGAAFTLACLLGASASCGSDDEVLGVSPEPAPSAGTGGTEPGPGRPLASEARGDRVSTTLLGALDAGQVSSYLSELGIAGVPARGGVRAYRLVYRSIDPQGAPVLASSLVALPEVCSGVLDQAVWMHGTTVYRGEAASVNAESSDRGAAFAFAAACYMTTAPDYLGLGEGQGYHPYDHVPSEVTAALDALLASRQLAAELDCELSVATSVSGHSQGGPAALGLARAMAQGQAPGHELVALAPMSGPYDMRSSLALAIEGQIAYAAAYLGYLTVAWNRLHGLYAAPRDAFLPPYDQSVEQLFDNEHTAEQVFAGLPTTLDALFTPSFLESLRQPSGALRQALDEASQVCDWRPPVEVRLYASTADADVPIANSVYCQQAFLDNLASVRLIDWQDADHAESFARSLPLVIEQFDAAGSAR